MSRKSLLVSVLLLVLLTGGGLGGSYLLLRHEPNFYSLAEVPPGPERQKQSDECVSQATTLLQQKMDCEADWGLNFTQEQINRWLAEGFVASNMDQFLPTGVSDPRIVFLPWRILLAFRYGEEQLSTVVSVQVKVWLPKRERNMVAVEIESLRAGAIPLSWKLLQEHLTEEARHQNIDIQWYRKDGNPVAILRFQADKREPTIQFQKLRIEQGTIHIQGRSSDPEVRKIISAIALPQSAPTE